MWVVEDENGNQNFIPFSDGNRILVNDPINEFWGYVDNLWSNPLNWSLGFVPTADQTAIIRADCELTIKTTIKRLIVNSDVQLVWKNSTELSVVDLLVSGIIDMTTGGVLNISGSDYYISDVIVGTGAISYNGDGTKTILPITYNYLTAYGSGVRLLPSNLSANYVRVQGINGWPSNVILNVDNYDFIVNTLVFSINGSTGAGGGYGRLRKTSLGNITRIIGDLELQWNIELSTGVEIEVGGHISGNIGGSGVSNLRKLKLIGEEQIINLGQGWLCEELMITGTITNRSSGTVPVFTPLTPNVSKIDNRSTLIFTGIAIPNNLLLYVNQEANVFGYGRAGNQDIRLPDDGDGYKELRLQGSGVKKLTGNTACEHLYFGGTATLDNNGYTLTYPKYTDTRNVNSSVPNGEFEEVNLISTTGIKALSGNIICNIMNCTPLGSGTAYIDFNGFTITAVIFNDVINKTTHPGGVRNDVLITSGFSSVTLATGMVINGVINNLSANITVLGASMSLSNSSTMNYNRSGGTQDFVAGVATYQNLMLSGASGSVKRLVQNVIVNGTYTKSTGVTLNKNGFTIKDSNGNDLE